MYKRQIVIVDEADYLNPNSTQPAFRGFIEEFAGNCRFIFTCNFPNRIMEPLRSRCSMLDFQIPEAEKSERAKEFYARIQMILEEKNVEYEPKVVVALIKKFFPDFRKTLNELQTYAISGKIDSGILSDLKNNNIEGLIDTLKRKSFKDMRKWIDDNPSIDQVQLFSKLYENSYNMLQPQTIPNLILILDEYITKAQNCANPKINLAACFVHVMNDVEFK